MTEIEANAEIEMVDTISCAAKAVNNMITVTSILAMKTVMTMTLAGTVTAATLAVAAEVLAKTATTRCAMVWTSLAEQSADPLHGACEMLMVAVTNRVDCTVKVAKKMSVRTAAAPAAPAAAVAAATTMRNSRRSRPWPS